MRSSAVIVIAAIAGCLGERRPFTNRMAQSSTSYLVRAARQPVRWQPWGRDAFALAAKLDRPVLLYIGSDGCRWCVESDRTIYANPEIGALINALFVPVRVDRDERPDIARRYQAAVEHLAGLHGWPLTVFLTDEGWAFFGGTYFPADDPITGRGLRQLLPEIARSYREQRSSIDQQAALLRQLVRASDGESRGALRPALVQQGLEAVRQQLKDAVRNRSTNGSVSYLGAVALLFSADSLSRTVAERALALMLDTTAVLDAADEDPPALVRAAFATTLATAWTVTGTERYRELGRALVHELADTIATGFADQDAYVLEHALLAAATLGDSGVVRRGMRMLETLLQRTYARGRGVRHAPSEHGSPGSGTVPGLLQDQVQVAAACLAAYQVTAESRYLDIAADLAAIIDRSYSDSVGGYFDVTDMPTNSMPAPGGSARTKHVWDDVLPGPNAEAALVLERLAAVTRDPVMSATYHRRARKTLEAFAGAIGSAGIHSTTFLVAARKTLELR